MTGIMRLAIFLLPIMANLSSTHGSAIKEGYEEDEDCKWEKRIKYVVDYVPTCCRESR